MKKILLSVQLLICVFLHAQTGAYVVNSIDTAANHNHQFAAVALVLNTGPLAPNHDFFLAGQDYASSAQFDLCLTRVNNAGTVLWKRKYISADTSELTSCMDADSSGVFIGGRTNNVSPVTDYSFILKTDTSGIALWKFVIDSAFLSNVSAVHSLADGGCLATGSTLISGNHKAFVLRLDAAGNLIWYAAQSGIVFEDFAVLTNGDIVCCGYTSPIPGAFHSVLVSYSASGQLLWSHMYQEASGLHLNFLEMTANAQEIFVAGTVEMPDSAIQNYSPHTVLFRTDLQGNLIQSDYFDIQGHAFSQVYDLELTPNGNLVLEGQMSFIQNTSQTGTFLMQCNPANLSILQTYFTQEEYVLLDIESDSLSNLYYAGSQMGQMEHVYGFMSNAWQPGCMFRTIYPQSFPLSVLQTNFIPDSLGITSQLVSVDTQNDFNLYSRCDNLVGFDPDPEIQNGINFFPNPLSDIGKLVLNQPALANEKLIVTDALGRIISEYSIPSGEIELTISVGDYYAGIYWVSSTTGASLKLVVVH